MTKGVETVSAPRGSIVVALERQAVVWLSSIRPDGRPHIVPLWFLWDGESILVFSKPHAQKVRNLRADPRVMVAVGEPGVEFDVELIEAIAELAQVPTRRLLAADLDPSDPLARLGRPWLEGCRWRRIPPAKRQSAGFTLYSRRRFRTDVSSWPFGITTELVFPRSDRAFGRGVSCSI